MGLDLLIQVWNWKFGAKVYPIEKTMQVMDNCKSSPFFGNHRDKWTKHKVLESCFFLHTLFKDDAILMNGFDPCQRMAIISRSHEMSLSNIFEVEIFDIWWG